MLVFLWRESFKSTKSQALSFISPPPFLFLLGEKNRANIYMNLFTICVHCVNLLLIDPEHGNKKIRPFNNDYPIRYFISKQRFAISHQAAFALHYIKLKNQQWCCYITVDFASPASETVFALQQLFCHIMVLFHDWFMIKD